MSAFGKIRFIAQHSIKELFSPAKEGEEVELKYTLSRGDHRKLLAECQGLAQFEKHLLNAYFDTQGLHLKDHKISLRARLIDGKSANLCLKYPARAIRGAPRGLKVRTEVEEPVPVAKATEAIFGRASISRFRNLPMDRLRQFLPEEMVCQIQSLGTLETVRTYIQWIDGITLELDESLLFGKRFYELEIESQDPHRVDSLVRKWFKKLDIPVVPGRKSKQSRFFSGRKSKNKTGFVR